MEADGDTLSVGREKIVSLLWHAEALERTFEGFCTSGAVNETARAQAAAPSAMSSNRLKPTRSQTAVINGERFIV